MCCANSCASSTWKGACHIAEPNRLLRSEWRNGSLREETLKSGKTAGGVSPPPVATPKHRPRGVRARPAPLSHAHGGGLRPEAPPLGGSRAWQAV